MIDYGVGGAGSRLVTARRSVRPGHDLVLLQSSFLRFFCFVVQPAVMTLLLFKFFSMCERGAARGRAAANPRLLLRELLLVFESVLRLPCRSNALQGWTGCGAGRARLGRACLCVVVRTVGGVLVVLASSPPCASASCLLNSFSH